MTKTVFKISDQISIHIMENQDGTYWYLVCNGIIFHLNYEMIEKLRDVLTYGSNAQFMEKGKL